jgi:hypothetical protein
VAEPCTGLGVLRNFSLGGSYLELCPPVALQPGQILALTIMAPLPHLDTPEISSIAATGEVLRLDPQLPGSSGCGLAVRFLTGPSFNAPCDQSQTG